MSECNWEVPVGWKWFVLCQTVTNWSVYRLGGQIFMAVEVQSKG